jgi:hypothetical protein
VHADFWNDVRGRVLLLLTELGSAVPPAEQGDVHSVCRANFNINHKRIAARQLAVQRSRELAGVTNCSMRWSSRTTCI